VNHELGIGSCVHKIKIPAVKRFEFVSDRTPYIILIGHWCDINDLKLHAKTEDTTDGVKGSLYEELERVYGKFTKYQMKVLLGFNAKVGREDIFKPATGNGS
jgi:hypothetical protein